MIKKLIPFGILIVFGLISIAFLRGILFSDGILMGGDWGFPHTKIQMLRFSQSGFYTWSDRDILGTEQYILNILPFLAFIGLIAKVGITGEVFSKLILIFVFVFPALTMYLFCRFIHCGKIASFFSGFLFMTLPFFFNFAAMGWLFVLLSMGILPIALILFIKSIKDKNISYSLCVGILYSLATIQSQSLIWYPLVFISFIPFLVKNKKEFISYIRSLLIVILVFLVLNTYWLLPLFLSGGEKMLNTHLGSSMASLATWGRLSTINILRGWGSLFNEPYEVSTPNNIRFFSFFLPFVAYASLSIRKRSRLVVSLVLLSFIPLILFILGPSFIVSLPFSDVIRDIARFSVISSFSYVVLVGITLDTLFKKREMGKKTIGIILTLFLIINTYPFWARELSGEMRLQYDVKLRTYSFPSEYSSVEGKVDKEPADIKVLYLPIVGELSMLDNARFHGVYRGIRDIYASYSPKPGHIGLSDKSKGASASLASNIDDLTNQLPLRHLPNVLALMNVKYVVVRRNMTHPTYEDKRTGEKIAQELKKRDELYLDEEWKKIIVFRNDNVLPHIYIPKQIIHTKQSESSIFKITSVKDYATNSVLFFDNQNENYKNANYFLSSIKESTLNQRPTVEYKKINPTKYRVIIHNAKSTFPLVFLESYHYNWRLYPKIITNSTDKSSLENNYSGQFISKFSYGTIQNNNLPDGRIYETWKGKPIFEDGHLIANGYANSWIIQPNELCNQQGVGYCQKNQNGSYDFEFVLEFTPQKYFYIGAIISVISLSVFTLFIFFNVMKFIIYRNKSTIH